MKATTKLIALLSALVLMMSALALSGCGSASAELPVTGEVPYTADPIGVEGLTKTVDTVVAAVDELAAEAALDGGEVVEDADAPEGTVAVVKDGVKTYVSADTAAAAVSTGSTTSSAPSVSAPAASAPAAPVHEHSYSIPVSGRIGENIVRSAGCACGYTTNTGMAGMDCPACGNYVLSVIMASEPVYGCVGYKCSCGDISSTPS